MVTNSRQWSSYVRGILTTIGRRMCAEYGAQNSRHMTYRMVTNSQHQCAKIVGIGRRMCAVHGHQNSRHMT